jgi:hypothetical protein
MSNFSRGNLSLAKITQSRTNSSRSRRSRPPTDGINHAIVVIYAIGNIPGKLDSRQAMQPESHERTELPVTAHGGLKLTHWVIGTVPDMEADARQIIPR